MSRMHLFIISGPDAERTGMVERTRLETLRSYTELDATFKRRTGLPGFDSGRLQSR